VKGGSYASSGPELWLVEYLKISTGFEGYSIRLVRYSSFY
jgi:hypothetical protein